MAGISGFGVYSPKYRMGRDVMARAWGPRFISGERAVANHDEDSLTMAVEAALNSLAGTDPRTVDGLIFASTTSPYLEKQASTLVATALDFAAETVTFTPGHAYVPPAGQGVHVVWLRALRDARLCVPVSFAGGTYSFLMDTGARRCVLRHDVGCNPCREGCPARTCMQAIEVDEVVRAVRELVAASKRVD